MSARGGTPGALRRRPEVANARPLTHISLVALFMRVFPARLQ